MLQKECCEAANVRVVKRALFITRNSLKSHEERNLLSPVSNTRAITPKLYTYSNPRFFENSRLRIEITRDTIFDSARRTVLRIPSRGLLLWMFAYAGPGVRGV